MKNKFALTGRIPFAIVLSITFCCTWLAAGARESINPALSVYIGKDTSLPIKQSSVTTLELSAKTEGNVRTYTWTQLSGAPVSFSSQTTSSVVISGFTEGYYSFKCEVSDGSATASDIISIRAVNYQNKNRIPCRTGAPKVWTLSATNEFDLVYPYLRRDGRDIQGGDTIKINRNPKNNGVYARFYLGDFGGDEGCPVIVVPNGQIVEIGGTSQRWHLGKHNNNTSDSNFVNHAVIDGTYLRDKGIQYGFQSTGSSWGLSTSMVTDLEIKGVLFENNSLGIQMKIYSDSTYNWTVYDNFIMKNIKIHDNYFQNIRSNEGMYIGHTSPSGTSQAGNDGPTPRMDSVFIYDNFLDSSGWDAMQVSSSRYSELHDNIIMHSALVNASSQNWGLLMGGNSTGKIYNNIVYNGTSGTLGTLGYGQTEIFYNFLDSTTGSSMYINGITTSILEADIPGMLPPLKVNIHDNIMSRFEANAIHHTNNEKRALSGVIENNYVVHPTKSLAQTIISNAGDLIRNNNLVKSFPVTVRNIGDPVNGRRIRVTQGADAAEFTNAKSAIDWLFQRISGGPVPNQPPVVDAGVAASITLPVSTIILKGTASDPDGSIVSYNWSKISGPASPVILTPLLSTTIVNALLVPGIYKFRLEVKDDLGAIAADTVQISVLAAIINTPPVVSAGQDVVITLPTNTVRVKGTATDAGGSIASYAWNYVSGPSQYSIVSPTMAETNINGLVQGVYRFEFKATDNSGAVSKDTVTVTVNPAPNQPPVANAGPNINTVLPQNSVTLNGSASYDADGSIVGFDWKYLTGPSQYAIISPTQPQTVLNSLVQGVYRFQLTVTDNKGATGKDTITITVSAASVPNQLPVAVAGADIVLTLPQNSTTINGGGSYDADGTISSFDWAYVSGPSQYTLATPKQSQTIVSNMVQGVYRFELKVIDNLGGVAKDTISITVNLPPNQLPVAKAGNDISLTLPQNSASLNGEGSYDPDGTITAFNWSYVSGPSQYTIQSPQQAQTMISNLVQGSYRFALRVTDNRGGTAQDTVVITVAATPPPNQLPFANAGNDVTITLPTSSLIISGNLSYDPDGIISSYYWRKVEGPASFTIESVNQVNTLIKNLGAGVYRFELTVTDNKGATDRDSVTVTVNPGIAPNQPPVADAGNDLYITLPQNSVTLSGSGTDADGSIAGYKWAKISGPVSYVFSAQSQQKTIVSNLTAGVYQFELTVTDDDGAVARDIVSVTVNPEETIPNEKPVANAGADQKIAVPLSSTSLDGSNSFDADGPITGYKWRQVSGPSAALIRAGSSALTQVSELIEGVYEFELTVTDNRNATATDKVIVEVLPEESDLASYPNPATDYIEIAIRSSTQRNNTDLQIFDVRGDKVHHERFMRNSPSILHRVDINHLSKGIYFIKVQIDINKSKVIRFLKQ